MNMKNRLLSLILCLAMSLALAAPVSAEELPQVEVQPTAVEVITEEENQVTEAVETQEVEEKAEEDIQQAAEPVVEEEKAPAEETQDQPAKEAPIDIQDVREAVPAESQESQDEPASDDGLDPQSTQDEDDADDEDNASPRTAPVPGSLSFTKLSLKVGQQTTLSLNGAVVSSMTSSNPSVVSVSRNGGVTAKSIGSAVITVTDTNGLTYPCSVKVSSVLNSSSISLAETKTAVLSISGSAIKSVSTSNPKVATITKAGKVTAVAPGSCTVTLTDAAGGTYRCMVTVSTSYLNRMAKNAKYVYDLIVKLHCKAGTGTTSLAQLKKKKKVTCNSAASIAMQLSGILPSGKTMGHTEAKGGNEVKKKNTVSKAIKKTNLLKKGTYTIVRAGKKFSQLPAKYKQAGMIYIQDSNMCVSAGGGYLYSCNEGSNQMSHGRYVRTKVSSGYPFTHPVLYIIVPKG